MQTLPVNQISSEDIIEINVGQFGRDNWQWGLVIDVQPKGQEFSFFVRVGAHMFWTEDFDATHEFNVLIKDPTIEVSIRG